jgi:hypothetical protein
MCVRVNDFFVCACVRVCVCVCVCVCILVHDPAMLCETQKKKTPVISSFHKNKTFAPARLAHLGPAVLRRARALRHGQQRCVGVLLTGGERVFEGVDLTQASVFLKGANRRDCVSLRLARNA